MGVGHGTGEVVMRVCIKCKRELPDDMFYDNWRHKVNKCKACCYEYIKAYRKLKADRKAKEVLL